ncbi:MAG TPA: hypothetical protein VFB59_01775 [Candidatus Saccharimonadales bacterium]|nr:hypothetical protein [Candidatus Saccharimonadales bacterium]
MDQRIPPELSEHEDIKRALALENPAAFDTLTAAEHRIFPVLALGATVAKAATILRHDDGYIRNVRAQLPPKVGAKSFDQFTYMAIYHGILKLRPDEDPGPSHITPAEERNIGLAALGLSIDQGAKILIISPGTFKNRRQILFGRWDIRTARGLIVQSFVNGRWQTKSQAEAAPGTISPTTAS